MLARFRIWNLDDEKAPVRFARRGTVAVLNEWTLAHLAEEAELLVSELVTNAVRHGKPPVRLSVAVTGGVLEISVRDGSPDLPEQRPGDEDGGFGLTVAAALAEVSVHPFPGGKQVRASLPLRPLLLDRASCP